MVAALTLCMISTFVRFGTISLHCEGSPARLFTICGGCLGLLHHTNFIGLQCAHMVKGFVALHGGFCSTASLTSIMSPAVIYCNDHS